MGLSSYMGRRASREQQHGSDTQMCTQPTCIGDDDPSDNLSNDKVMDFH